MNKLTKKYLIVFLCGAVFGVGVAFVGYKMRVQIKMMMARTEKAPATKAKPKIKENVSLSGPAGSGLISNFENEEDIKKWSGNKVKLELSQDENLEGQYCLKISQPEGGYPGVSAWRAQPSDWRAFHSLKFDIYNPQEEVLQFGVLIKDEQGDSYAQRYDGYFALRPGMNNFELNITGLKSNNKRRQIQMDQIKELVIFLSNPAKETVIYLDNVRLEKDEQQQLATSAGAMTISTFEDKRDLGKWSGGFKVKTQLSKEHCSGGDYCLKAVYPPGGFPGLNGANAVPSDWSRFDSLKFDVYNPEDEVVKFGILLKDSGADHYADRYDGYFALRPGMNNFELNITGLKANNKRRSLEMDKIRELVIFLFEPAKKTTLYFDNIRLETARSAGVKNLYRFDFGAEESEVWPGFIKITNETKYTKQEGYGWGNTAGLRAEDRRYPDPLFRDWVRGRGPFNVDLPNGEYVVYMMLEDPGFWEYYQNYEKREVTAEGEVVVRDYLDSHTFFSQYYFKHLDTEDVPGADIWEKYVRTRFTPKIFSIKVQDGQLNLSFSPHWGYACTLSALVIYPLENQKQGEEFIAQLDKKRKDYFNAHFIESTPKTTPLSFSLSDIDRRRGYILFAKNYLEHIYPNTQPKQKEIKAEITLFAAPGEREPLNIAIYPLRDLGECTLTAEDLSNQSGKQIPAKNVDIRTTQYKLKLQGEKVYGIRGELLRTKNKAEIKKGLTRQFWLTVKVPENQPSGEYQGNINFTPTNGEAEKITLKVKVLPFELAEADIPLGMFYFIPAHFRWYMDTRQILWGRIEEQLWDMKEHNINSLAIGISPEITMVHEDGRVEFDFRDLDEFIHLYKHYGFTQPIVGYGMPKLIRQAEKISQGDERLFSMVLANIYKAIKEHVQNLYGPEIIFCLADEISNVEGQGIEYAVKLGQITQKFPGITTTAMLNNKRDDVIFPYLDISTINNGMRIDASLLGKIKKSGSELWLYNIARDRFSFGFYLAKVGARGRLQWNYQLPAVDPYFDLDGREQDFCASYPSMDGPINSVWFEWIREGIDDYRYILTLSKMIEKAKSSSDPAIITQAREAEMVLAGVLDDVQIELGEEKWAVGEYDQKRWIIAEEITKLTEVLQIELAKDKEFR